MSAPSSGTSWTGLLAGRWQMPLAIIAATAAGLSLLQLAPKPPPKADLPAVLADIDLLEAHGDLVGAAHSIEQVLAAGEPALDPPMQATLHERLVDLLYRTERSRVEHSAPNLESLLEHDRAARSLGRATTPELEARSAIVESWLGRQDEAVSRLLGVLDEGLPPETYNDALRTLVGAVNGRQLAPAARLSLLNALAAMPHLPASHVWWAVQQIVDAALEAGDVAAARRSCDENCEPLKTADYAGYARYLDAQIDLADGRVEDAYPAAWWVEEWLPQRSRSAESFDRLANLPVLNRLLLGQIQLKSNEPSAALSSFEYTLALRPDAELRIKAATGKAAALAALGRHDAARDALHELLSTIGDPAEQRTRAVLATRDTLVELHRARRAAGDTENAITYLKFAIELTPAELADARRNLVESLASTAEDGIERTDGAAALAQLHEAAAQALDEAAALAGPDDERRADLLWMSASHYDDAGRLADARRVLEQFASGRLTDRRTPAALLKLGEIELALGEIPSALKRFHLVTSEYPELDLAATARVRAAEALVALGPEHHAEAESLLVAMLNDGRIAPAAPLYRDALLTLGKLYDVQDRFGAAIARMEAFEDLYPDDPVRLEIHTRLADAYRRSAAALADTPADAPDAAAAHDEARTRYTRAAEAYARVLDLLQTREDDPLRAAYETHAMLGQADCLFELDTPDSLRQALAIYQQAAARLEGQPDVLAAYVQIANIHLRLGERAEAARALEHGRWLLSGLPDTAFARDATGERAAWERFFEVVLSSTLFGDALAAR